jgi:NADH:ubiquinone oxidoreductase subunit F (NADH-binding)
MQETRLVLRNLGKITNPARVEEYVACGGYAGLKKALGMAQDELIAVVKESGLRGRGGAGFPTGLKWQFTKGTAGNQKYIVCNADEGEPGTNKDRIILANDPNALFEGMAIAGLACGATKGYIYLRAEYPYLFAPLREAIANATAAGYLGENMMGSGKAFDITVASGAGAYVCGEETALLESIEGKRGEPRFKPPYPASAGLFGCPTVINNVETLANVAQIILNGAAWFKGFGTERCPGTKLFTLCGNVNRPGVYEFEMGVNLKALFEEVGGGCDKPLLGVQTGGASGGIIRADQMDIALDIESCQAAGATLGSGAMMFIDQDQDMLDVVENLMEFFVEESCGKCTPCREGNMRLLELVTKIKQGKGCKEDIDTMYDLAGTMMCAALCGLGQASPTPVTTTLDNFRPAYEAAIEGGNA